MHVVAVRVAVLHLTLLPPFSVRGSVRDGVLSASRSSRRALANNCQGNALTVARLIPTFVDRDTIRCVVDSMALVSHLKMPPFEWLQTRYYSLQSPQCPFLCGRTIDPSSCHVITSDQNEVCWAVAQQTWKVSPLSLQSALRLRRTKAQSPLGNEHDRTEFAKRSFEALAVVTVYLITRTYESA